MDLSRQIKINIYTPLANELKAKGYEVVVEAILVGSLGSWDLNNEPVLRMLHISREYAKKMRKLMTSETIKWSRDIYVQHITDVQQNQPVTPLAD